MVILVQIIKKHGDVKIWGIKVAWAKKKKVYLLLSHSQTFPSTPTMHKLYLISVLNADMKFMPHLPKPKGIGQQDTVSLPQQKNR